ncbi:MAG: (Fe-S)-binding protein [Candidatus Eiseniibacteriota bacterium]|nr:MAG: (Fe-S)-binding protein [Candidatus Eisenbacteria bacterium]
MEVTREIYWNIESGKLVYLFAVLALSVAAFGLYSRYLLWSRGKPEERFDNPPRRLASLLAYGLAQLRVLRHPVAGLMHLALFSGFLVLLIATLLIAVQENAGVHFLQGDFYLGFSLFADVFGLLILLGVGVALGRRLLKPGMLETGARDLVVLAGIFLIVLTGFLTEGFRMASPGGSLDVERLWSPGGNAVAAVTRTLVSQEEFILSLHRYMWWIHMFVSMAFLGYVGWSKLSHLLFSPLNIYFRSFKPKGRLKSIPDLESAQSFGVERIEQFTWKQLLDLDACTECCRCRHACPAFMTDKPLSPKEFILKLRAEMEGGPRPTSPGGTATCTDSVQSAGGPSGPRQRPGGPSEGQTDGSILGRGVVSEEEVWECRTCFACQEECPVFVEHLDKLMEFRRYLVMTTGKMPASAEQAMTSLMMRNHPWGRTEFTRETWAEKLGIKELSEGDTSPLLFWVGCTSALVDQNVEATESLAKILQAAGVQFGILGSQEICCGDPARRMGNDYSFVEMARKNVELFTRYGVEKIVTACPHCFNTFKNEYSDFGANLDVVHHSQFIAELLRDGRLTIDVPLNRRICYHDSCYLGRYNDIYEAPREVLAAAGGTQPLEMASTRSSSFCCGGGGGHAWMEETGGTRIGNVRVNEALETGAEVLATACPFCLQLLRDGVKGVGAEGRIEVLDIAELVQKDVRTGEKEKEMTPERPASIEKTTHGEDK